MALHNLSAYRVIQNNGFTIRGIGGGGGAGSSDVKKLTFNLPADFLDSVAVHRPVLNYIIKPETDDVHVGIWVNPQQPLTQSTQVESLRWPKGPRMDQALWTAPSASRFKKGQQNELWFRAWRGRVRIRGVVISYYRRIQL